MSSNTVDQNDADENLNIALNRANIKGSQHPYSSQWMDHWTRSSSNSTSQIQKDLCVPGKGKNSGFREARMLSIEVMRSKITENGCSEPGKEYIHSDIGSEKGIIEDKKIYSLRNNEDSSVDWKKFDACQFPSSETMNFEWNHFPMYDVNRKFECLLSSMKKSTCDTMTVRMAESQFHNSESVLASHTVKFASEEHHLQIWSMAENTDHGTSSSKSAEDSSGNQVDHSGPVFDYHRLNMAAPMYSSKQVSPLRSKPPCDKVSKEAHHTFLEHDQYNRCRPSTFPPSEMEDDSQMMRRSTSRFENKTVQLRTTCYRDGISFPILIHERDKEILSDSKTISPSHDCQPGLRRFSDFKHPNQHKMLKFLDSQYFPLAQKTEINLSDRGKMIQEPTNSAAAKGTALENIALPAMSQCHEKRTASLKLLNSISSEDKYKSGINPNPVKNQLESSVKTKGIHSDATQSPICTKGVNSSRPQKQTSSPVKEAIVRNARSDLPEVNQHLNVSEIGESSTSRTESMGEDHVLFQIEKMDNLKSTRPFCLESSNRWVKRLRHDPSAYFAHGTKRLKLADAFGSGKSCTLYNEVLNCNGSSSDLPPSSKEQKESDKAIVLKERGECSSEKSSKPLNSWIRRWCYSSQQTTPQVTQTVPVLTKLGGTKAMPERTDVKKLPSLAAMALMGKAVSSFRPCEFQRRGSSVVWNTEEL